MINKSCQCGDKCDYTTESFLSTIENMTLENNCGYGCLLNWEPAALDLGDLGCENITSQSPNADFNASALNNSMHNTYVVCTVLDKLGTCSDKLDSSDIRAS